MTVAREKKELIFALGPAAFPSNPAPEGPRLPKVPVVGEFGLKFVPDDEPGVSVPGVSEEEEPGGLGVLLLLLLPGVLVLGVLLLLGVPLVPAALQVTTRRYKMQENYKK